MHEYVWGLSSNLHPNKVKIHISKKLIYKKSINKLSKATSSMSKQLKYKLLLNASNLEIISFACV